MEVSSTQPSVMRLTGAQQRELAEWLAEGAEPDPRWTEPKPPEGALQFVTPSAYSELRLVRRIFSPGSGQGDWAMLALRAGNRIVEFALSAEWQLQLADWLRAPHFKPVDLGDYSFPNAIAGEPCHTVAAGETVHVNGATGKITPASEPQSGPSCKSCPFWEGQQTGHSDGLCRVSPPSRAITGMRAVWPETNASDYCGQHPGFRVVIDGDGATLEAWERNGTIPPGYADSWDRSPEDVAKAGTLTWAVAQLGAVANPSSSDPFDPDTWTVQGHPVPLRDWELIALANRRANCLHEATRARTDRPGLICHDCGETSEDMEGIGR